jgi:hypothetical protein
MDKDRSTAINIGGQEYQLILTTKATKEIAGRYGGLENLGDKLMKAENFEMALDEIVWLITLLANQSLLIHNLRNPNKKIDRIPYLLASLDIISKKTAGGAVPAFIEVGRQHYDGLLGGWRHGIL